jgi:hypothetical protein
MTLKEIMLYAAIGIGSLVGCQDQKTIFTESADLNGDGSKERVIVHAGRQTSIEIQELNQVRAEKRGLFGQAYLTYDNQFFSRTPYLLNLPINPQSVGFRDVNGDGYKDLFFHSEKSWSLESYVAQQTEDGRFKQPKRIDIQPHIDLDKAMTLYQRSLESAFKGDWGVAIHFAEWSLEFLNPENPLHHGGLSDVYQDLLRFYEETNNQEKREVINAKSLNLKLFRGRI